MKSTLTAETFAERLLALQSREELLKHQRYFRFDPDNQPADNHFIGVRMGSIFELGKEFTEMPVDEIEQLLESPIHEIRVGAMSIMGQSAKHKKCSEQRLKQLYDLYIRRHDRINDWDLVDLAAYYLRRQVPSRQTTGHSVRSRSLQESLGAPNRDRGDRSF